MIDRPWLEREAARAPVEHAYPLWDLLHDPTRVRFVSARLGDRTVGYLCVWLGRPERPIVHWHGSGPEASALVAALPGPPFIAFAPREAEPWIAARRPRASVVPLQMMLRERAAGLPSGELARRLQRADRPALEGLLRTEREEELAGYSGLEPEVDPAWGVFANDRLLGVARASVRLPLLWVVSGVYVRPEARGRGLGRSLVGAVIAAAAEAGAPVGLFVREDAEPARRLYAHLGFRAVGERRRFTVPASGS